MISSLLPWLQRHVFISLHLPILLLLVLLESFSHPSYACVLKYTLFSFAISKIQAVGPFWTDCYGRGKDLVLLCVCECPDISVPLVEEAVIPPTCASRVQVADWVQVLCQRHGFCWHSKVWICTSWYVTNSHAGILEINDVIWCLFLLDSWVSSFMCFDHIHFP